MQRHNTNDLQTPNRMTRNIMEKSAVIKWTLKVVGAFGVSLLLAGKQKSLPGYIHVHITNDYL